MSQGYNAKNVLALSNGLIEQDESPLKKQKQLSKSSTKPTQDFSPFENFLINLLNKESPYLPHEMNQGSKLGSQNTVLTQNGPKLVGPELPHQYMNSNR